MVKACVIACGDARTKPSSSGLRPPDRPDIFYLFGNDAPIQLCRLRLHKFPIVSKEDCLIVSRFQSGLSRILSLCKAIGNKADGKVAEKYSEGMTTQWRHCFAVAKCRSLASGVGT